MRNSSCLLIAPCFIIKPQGPGKECQRCSAICRRLGARARAPAGPASARQKSAGAPGGAPTASRRCVLAAAATGRRLFDVPCLQLVCISHCCRLAALEQNLKPSGPESKLTKAGSSSSLRQAASASSGGAGGRRRSGGGGGERAGGSEQQGQQRQQQPPDPIYNKLDGAIAEGPAADALQLPRPEAGSQVGRHSSCIDGLGWLPCRATRRTCTEAVRCPGHMPAGSEGPSSSC